MKKTPAEVNVEKLEAWIAKQTDQDIKELNYRGSTLFCAHTTLRNLRDELIFSPLQFGSRIQ